MFLPIANVSNGNPAIMTFMDINGVLTVVLLGWLFSRYSKPAFYWLLPLIVWMPMTAFFKILLWLETRLKVVYPRGKTPLVAWTTTKGDRSFDHNVYRY